MNIFARFLRDEEGVSIAEYALLVSLVTVVLATAISTIGDKFVTTIDNASQTFK